MDLTSLKILFVPMMQILLCVVITTLFKMAMHVPKKKDEADQVEQEASKEPEMSELEKQLEFQRELKKQTSLDALLRKQQDNLTKKPAGAKNTNGTVEPELMNLPKTPSSKRSSLDSLLATTQEADKAVELYKKETKDLESRKTTGLFCGCFSPRPVEA